MINQFTAFFMGVVFTALGLVLGGILGGVVMLLFCLELITYNEVLNKFMEKKK